MADENKKDRKQELSYV